MPSCNDCISFATLVSRWSPNSAPEHTLAAYRLALAMGADFVEQDLQMTSDGVLVCLHDTTLERTTDVQEVFPDRFEETDVDEPLALQPMTATDDDGKVARPTWQPYR